MSPDELQKMITERDIEVNRQLSLLRSLVRKYPLDEFLMVLGALNWPGNNASNYLNSIIGNKKEEWLLFQIYIPALAKHAILNSNDYIGVHNRPFDEAFQDIKQSLALINEIKDQIPFDFADDFNLVLSSFQFFIANQQYRFQTTLSVAKNIISRSFVLFRNLPAEMFPSLNLSLIFQDIYGLNQRIFFIISASLLGLKKHDWFDFSNFSGLDNMGNNLKIDDLKIYFNRLSLSYSEFRYESRNEARSFTGKSSQFYGYTPFDKYPILNHKQKYIIISQHYLIWRTYLPIYYDFLEFFTEKEKKVNNSFSNSFGKVFQKYVGLMLSLIKDGSQIIDEIKYGKSKKDFVDLSLLYPEKDSAILFEVKKHIIPLKAKFSMDKKTIKNSITDTIIKGFIQINKKIKSIRENEKGLELFPASYSYYPIVITFDDSYCLNDFFIRSIINDKLNELKIHFDMEWQVITIREFEQIIYTCNKDKSFLDLLKNKLANNSIYHEWDKYLVDSGVEIKDNEYLRSIIRNELN